MTKLCEFEGRVETVTGKPGSRTDADCPRFWKISLSGS